jgi:hypothetical protein
VIIAENLGWKTEAGISCDKTLKMKILIIGE